MATVTLRAGDRRAERQRGGQEGRLPAGRCEDLAGELLRLLPAPTGGGSVRVTMSGSECRTEAVVCCAWILRGYWLWRKSLGSCGTFFLFFSEPENVVLGY